MSSFGKLLREHRNRAGLSLRDLANSLYISHVFLGSIEREERKVLPEKYWNTLICKLPSLNLDLLKRHEKLSNGIFLNVEDSSELLQDVAIAFDRRIQNNSLSDDELENLLRILLYPGV